MGTEKEKNNPMIILKILFLLEFVFGESGARMFDPGLGHCNSHQYPCQGTNLCISMRKVCDCSVDCPNGDDELECPAELMSIIEAEVEQCIKPTPIEGIVDGTAIDGACLEADFDQQRDCICTIQNTLDCASPTGRQQCVPTHLKAPDKPCCSEKEFFCHSKNQTQIHSRQNNGPNVIMSTSRKGTIWSPDRCYGPALACDHWEKISDCRDEPGNIYRDQHCTLNEEGVSEKVVEMTAPPDTLPCGIHEVCDLFFNRDNSSRSNFGFSLTLFACVVSMF